MVCAFTRQPRPRRRRAGAGRARQLRHRRRARPRAGADVRRGRALLRGGQPRAPGAARGAVVPGGARARHRARRRARCSRASSASTGWPSCRCAHARLARIGPFSGRVFARSPRRAPAPCRSRVKTQVVEQFGRGDGRASRRDEVGDGSMRNGVAVATVPWWRCRRSAWSVAIASAASPRAHAAGDVPRVLLPNALRRKRAGRWVERVGVGHGSRRRRHVRAAGRRARSRGCARIARRTTRTRPGDVGVRTAPTGETIAGATLWRAGDATGARQSTRRYQFWLAGPTMKSNHLSDCLYLEPLQRTGAHRRQPLSSRNRVTVPATNLGAHLYAECFVRDGSRRKLPKRCRRRPQRLRRRRLPLRGRPDARTDGAADGDERERRTDERADGDGDERRCVRRERPGLGRLRGGVQRGRAGRAERRC